MAELLGPHLPRLVEYAVVDTRAVGVGTDHEKGIPVTRSLRCMTCQKPIAYKGNGRPPKRHEECAARVRRKRDKHRKRRDRGEVS